MSGIPLQRRTEYCLFVVLSRDILSDSFLFFSPIRKSIKVDVGSHVYILSDEGRWWFVYQKPWEQGEEKPSRFVVMFGREKEVTIKTRRLFKKWRDTCVVPLRVSMRPIQLIECDECMGSGMKSTDYMDIPIEETCSRCKGLGSYEKPEEKPEFDFVHEEGLKRAEALKSAEEYDQFLMRLRTEKSDRIKKRKRH